MQYTNVQCLAKEDCGKYMAAFPEELLFPPERTGSCGVSIS
jgi:hypothetical protein